MTTTTPRPVDTRTAVGTSRSRWRRRLLLAGLVPLLASLGFTAKVADLVIHDRAGRSAYAAGHYPTARDAYAHNLALNLLEPWVASYDVGTAQLRIGDYPEARASLTVALAAVPEDQACRVRINLSLTLEALGDAADADGEPATAHTWWQQGVDTLADGGCLVRAGTDPRLDRDRGSTSDGQTGDARTTDARLRDKLSDPVPPKGPKRPKHDPSAQRLQELNDRGEKARHRNQQHQKDHEAKPPPNATGPDYQW